VISNSYDNDTATDQVIVFAAMTYFFSESQANKEFVLTSHTRQWCYLAPVCVVPARGLPRSTQCISIITIEDASCAALNVLVGARCWNHSSVVRNG